MLESKKILANMLFNARYVTDCLSVVRARDMSTLPLSMLTSNTSAKLGTSDILSSTVSVTLTI